MIVSIETPVFKGRMLRRLIDSVLHQSSPNWHYSLLWDGGDEESRRILEELEAQNHPQVTVYFAENRGIARARRFLSENSKGEFILPVDDDDALPFHCIERLLEVAAQKPWASVIRAQRKMIDEEGKVLEADAWFPFEHRHYQNGMVTDLMNHTHPYLISRWAYERTSGWEGFEDFGFAGEDCDIYLKLEEVGTIELLDETLYYYRIHPDRASLVLTEHGAYEMWRRLADKTIERIGLPLKRVSERQPYIYERQPRSEPTPAMVDIVIRAEGDAGRSRAEHLSGSLQEAGVDRDAVHIVDSDDLGAVNQAIQLGSRPIVCLLDTSIQLDGAHGLGKLLRMVHENEVDLASPKLIGEDGGIIWANPGFEDGPQPGRNSPAEGDADQHDRVEDAGWLCDKALIARREVIRAVGGLDEGYDDVRMAVVDFSLRARQRDFRSSYLGTMALVCSAPVDEGGDAGLERLRLKWAEYPHLCG